MEHICGCRLFQYNIPSNYPIKESAARVDDRASLLICNSHRLIEIRYKNVDGVLKRCIEIWYPSIRIFSKAVFTEIEELPEIDLLCPFCKNVILNRDSCIAIMHLEKYSSEYLWDITAYLKNYAQVKGIKYVSKN